jgi:hypothetical protein
MPVKGSINPTDSVTSANVTSVEPAAGLDDQHVKNDEPPLLADSCVGGAEPSLGVVDVEGGPSASTTAGPVPEHPATTRANTSPMIVWLTAA